MHYVPLEAMLFLHASKMSGPKIAVPLPVAVSVVAFGARYTRIVAPSVAAWACLEGFTGLALVWASPCSKKWRHNACIPGP